MGVTENPKDTAKPKTSAEILAGLPDVSHVGSYDQRRSAIKKPSYVMEPKNAVLTTNPEQTKKDEKPEEAITQ